MDEKKIKYEQLASGFQFTPVNFTIDHETVSQYLAATGDNNPVYKGIIVPPMAIAARALAAMAEKFDLLPGTVHVTQEVEFQKTVTFDEPLCGFFTVNRKVARGKFHMLNIGIKVMNGKNELILTGETGFILPVSGAAA